MKWPSTLLYHLSFIFLLSGDQSSCSPKTNAAAPADQKKPSGIWTTEWSKDGRYIAIGGDDSTIWVYNAHDFSLHRSFQLNSMVKGMRWHPFENLLAVANMKGIQLLDLKTETITTIPGFKGGGRGIGWNYTGELIALADGYGMVQVMNRNGKILRSIPKHDTKSYLSLDWHPSKNIIVTGGDEIILFDTSGKLLKMFTVREQYTGVLSVNWHPSGNFFASGDYGHEKEGKPTLLQFWTEDGIKLKEMGGHHEEIRNLRWSNDGKKIATASDALRIYNSDGMLLHTGTTKENLWGIAWSKDDRFLVTGSYGNGYVQVWDSKAKLLKDLH